MGLLTPSRTTRAQRKAQAKALKAKAKLEARLDSRGARRERRARRRHERRLANKQIRAQRRSDKTAAKVADDTNKADLKIAEAAANGTSLTPKKLKRYLSIAKVASPIVVPIAYRASTLAREQVTVWQANRAGVPIDELNKFSGHGAALSARISGAEKSLQTLRSTRDSDAETKQFIAAMDTRLTDLSGAVGAAEHMPAARRRGAHRAIERELTAIDTDLLARLGVRP